MDKDADDNCDYDSDGNGSRDKNWAIDWQNSHTINVDWYDCSPAHSQALNGNLKAYASWWLWAKLSGWDSASGTGKPVMNRCWRIIILYPKFSKSIQSKSQKSVGSLQHSMSGKL